MNGAKIRADKEGRLICRRLGPLSEMKEAPTGLLIFVRPTLPPFFAAFGPLLFGRAPRCRLQDLCWANGHRCPPSTSTPVSVIHVSLAANRPERDKVVEIVPPSIV